jgi:hypothetical protein
MSNANTIVGFIGGAGRNQIPVVTVTTASETNIPVVTDSGTNGVAVLSIPQQGAIVGATTPISQNANPAIIGQGSQAYGPIEGGQAPFYNSGSFDGRPFRIRLSGSVTSATAASQTILFTLYLGTSKSGTALKATTAFTGVATAGTYPFFLDATLLWDSVSQTVNGTLSSNISNTPVAAAALSTQGTGVTLANLNFNYSFTTAVAGSVSVAVKDFSLDLV